MVGGGGFGWEPGEWTDDTAMAIAIAEAAATGKDLRDESAQDAIVARWHGWAQSAKDVGVQTRSVLAHGRSQGITAARARTESEKLHRRTGRTAGNGSLMRTAPAALAYLDEEDALARAGPRCQRAHALRPRSRRRLCAVVPRDPARRAAPERSTYASG